MKPPKKPGKTYQNNDPKYEFNYHDYEYECQMIMTVNLPMSPGDKLYIIAQDGSCRGIGGIYLFPPANKNLMLVYMYSNKLEEPGMILNYFSHKKNHEYHVGNIYFKADEIFGTPTEPVHFNIFGVDEI